MRNTAPHEKTLECGHLILTWYVSLHKNCPVEFVIVWCVPTASILNIVFSTGTLSNASENRSKLVFPMWYSAGADYQMMDHLRLYNHAEPPLPSRSWHSCYSDEVVRVIMREVSISKGKKLLSCVGRRCKPSRKLCGDMWRILASQWTRGAEQGSGAVLIQFMSACFILLQNKLRIRLNLAWQSSA